MVVVLKRAGPDQAEEEGMKATPQGKRWAEFPSPVFPVNLIHRASLSGQSTAGEGVKARQREPRGLTEGVEQCCQDSQLQG